MTNNHAADNNHIRFSDRIRFSIVWKLNFKLFFRMLGVFLALDLMLILLLLAGLMVRAEQTAATSAEIFNQTSPYSAEAENWLALTEYSISPHAELEGQFQIPKVLQKHFPPPTAGNPRSFQISSSGDMSTQDFLENISYNITVTADPNLFVLSYHPQKTLQIFLLTLAVLLVIQLLMLLKNISSGAQLIRHTLRPIQELTEAAQNLSTDAAFSPEQLKALAGKLDNINAAKLDTRISVGETQSELQSLAAAINAMLDRINESYRSQVRFVSDASHELRTPISVIQGYANLLDRWGKKDEKALQESIDAIKDETANMKEMVEQLLFLARGDNNTMALNMERFDLASLAEEVLREAQMIDSGHEYTDNLHAVLIDADKSLIKQALRILVDNAVKYTPPSQGITISVSSTQGYACLTVQDEGIGIAPESVPRVLDRFYRADESRARATGGTGLGLSIAKWITERHDGHIEILSRENIGTRITLRLPAAPGEE
jgi:two-component system sensor histidine kinase ArlS